MGLGQARLKRGTWAHPLVGHRGRVQSVQGGGQGWRPWQTDPLLLKLAIGTGFIFCFQLVKCLCPHENAQNARTNKSN